MQGQQPHKSSLVKVNQEFSGPIPPPHLLNQYNQIIPGAAERILSMAERQTTHRLELEKSVITSDIKKSERGQVFGLLVATVGLLLAFILGMAGHQVAAGIIGGADIVSLAAIFVYGRRQKQIERQSARNQ